MNLTINELCEMIRNLHDGMASVVVSDQDGFVYDIVGVLWDRDQQSYILRTKPLLTTGNENT